MLYLLMRLTGTSLSLARSISTCSSRPPRPPEASPLLIFPVITGPHGSHLSVKYISILLQVDNTTHPPTAAFSRSVNCLCPFVVNANLSLTSAGVFLWFILMQNISSVTPNKIYDTVRVKNKGGYQSPPCSFKCLLSIMIL